MSVLHVAVVALTLQACSIATSPQQQAPSRLATSGTAQRVILASFDGLGADELSTFGAPAFARLPAHATRVIPVTPTATATTHTTILTGAQPSKTGIVSNQFHVTGTPVNVVARGLDEEIDVETLLEAAHRAGKRVGSIVFPTVDGKSPRRTPDWGVFWSERDTPARMLHLGRADFRPEWVPPTWSTPATTRHPSFSPAMRARLSWDLPARAHEDVDLAAYDSTDDHVTNYDTFFVEAAEKELPLDANRWFTVTRTVEGKLYGSWSKLVSFDPLLDSVTIYWGGITHTEASPASFQQLLDAEVGFWPGTPDESAARRWLAGKEGLDPDSFAEQNGHLSDFITRATALAIARMPFDLLLTYQPVVDEAEHVYRIDLPGEAFYSAANRAAGERVRRIAFAQFDAAVAAFAGSIDPARDALVVTGDHGVAAADTEVGINALLAGWGFATRSGAALAPDTHWAAYATGNVAHLYRFGGPADDDLVVQRLSSLKTTEGVPVFEIVRKKDAASHHNSGDVVAYAYPRFALSPTAQQAFAPTVTGGQHGGFNAHHEFHTTLGAGGAGVVPGTIPTLQQTLVASYVARLLGIEPPRDAERER